MSYRVKKGIDPDIFRLTEKKRDIHKSIEICEEVQRDLKKVFFDFTKIHNRTEMYGGKLPTSFFNKYKDIYNGIENLYQKIEEMKKELKEMEKLNP